MKTIHKYLSGCIILSLLLSGFMASASAAKTNMAHVEAGEDSGMPGWPTPAKPIPSDEVGKVSKAGSYSTTAQVEQMDVNQATGQPTGEVTVEDVKLSGVDALAADGLDPLVGNYNLVNWDSILLGSADGANINLKTYKSSASAVPPAWETLTQIPGSEKSLPSGVDYDMTAADLNNDGQAEQIVANAAAGQIYLSLGKMPGSPGRATSAPAVGIQNGGAMDVLVRGYDEALWHIHYNGSSWGTWDNAGGGTLLSAPAIASKGDGSFDAFALGSNNRTYRRHFDGSAWGADWTAIDTAADWPELAFWVGATPELPAPAAVVRGSGLDVFRTGPDNTLRWNHSSNGGTSWSGWQSLGGMLASSPAAVSLGSNHIQVFARGADGTLWFRVYNGAWDAWKRAPLNGVTAGVTFNFAPGVGNDLMVYFAGSDHQLWGTQCDSAQCGAWSPSGVLPADTDDPLVSGMAIGSGAWRFLACAESGALKYSSAGSAWVSFASLPPWTAPHATGATYSALKWNGWNNDSVRIRAGHFLGDGRPQLAMGYFTGSNQVTVAAYQTAGGFNPALLSSFTISSHAVDWFDITTGDFLPSATTGEYDGVDEIAFAYVNGTTYGVEILKFSGETGETLVSANLSATEASNAFAGTLNVVSGNFDGVGGDEIAMLWVGYLQTAPPYGSCLVRNRIYSHLRVFEVASNALTSHNLGDTNTEVIQNNADNTNTFPQQIGFALAAGDTDGDGQDEIVRTWPNNWGNLVYDGCAVNSYPRAEGLTRELDVINKDASAWTFATTAVRNLGTTTTSVRDRLAIGDLDRDFKNEIAWLVSSYGFITYALSGSSYSNYAWDLTLPAALPVPTLVVGNFTREGLRVGQPTYRVQNRVDTPLAVINMPPKHQDLVKDANGVYQVIKSPDESCDASTDPSCTHAKYAASLTQSSAEDITTKHAYTLSAGLSTKQCVGAGSDDIASVNACVSASIDYTHGGNFEKTTTEIDSITFSQTVIASRDDKLVYFGTPYGIWEYPVLSKNSDGAASSITVAFPLVSAAQSPGTAGGYDNGFCDETWFHAGHQPNNVWSYDPIGDIRFPDYDSTLALVYGPTVGDNAQGVITYADIAAVKNSQEFSHKIAASLGVEITGKAQLQVVNFTGEFRASLSGDYTNRLHLHPRLFRHRKPGRQPAWQPD